MVEHMEIQQYGTAFDPEVRVVQSTRHPSHPRSTPFVPACEPCSAARALQCSSAAAQQLGLAMCCNRQWLIMPVCFPPQVFDPSSLPNEDYLDALQKEWAAEEERRKAARAAGQGRVEFQKSCEQGGKRCCLHACMPSSSAISAAGRLSTWVSESGWRHFPADFAVALLTPCAAASQPNLAQPGLKPGLNMPQPPTLQPPPPSAAAAAAAAAAKAVAAIAAAQSHAHAQAHVQAQGGTAAALAAAQARAAQMAAQLNAAHMRR
jgi:hypothetical protein